MFDWRRVTHGPALVAVGFSSSGMAMVLLVAGVAAAVAQTRALAIVDRMAQAKSMLGAAEKAGRGWPYPEPAQRGATGFSPNYSDYGRPSERWDIYVNIVWRRTASRAKTDLEYYDYELGQFLDSMPDRDRARFRSAGQMLLVMEQIRGKVITLHREATTGCLLFTVKHSGRTDLATDNCEARN